jgi:lysozyme
MDTRDLQARLNSLGYPLVVDGIAGSRTDAAVRRFQRDHGLAVDGIVGPKTVAALNPADIPPLGARKMSPAGVKALADREGRRLTAYRDTKGILTVGIGHTSMAGAPTVYEGLTITSAQCDEIFARDIAKYEATVNEAIKRPIGQNQFDACVSLCYNIGQEGFKGSTIVKRINNGDMYGAAEAFLMWNKPAEIQKRRAGERLQFLKDVLTTHTLAAPLPPPDVEAPYSPPLPGEPGYVPPEKPGLHPVAFWTSIGGVVVAGVAFAGKALGWW